MRPRHKRLAAPLVVLTFALAGCGGAAVTVGEVPGGPVELSLPAGADALSPQATATATPTATATTTATEQATPAAGTTQSTGQAPAGTSQGTQTDGTQGNGTPDTSTTDQPPPAGSPADQFEEYCAQNPGAC